MLGYREMSRNVLLRPVLLPLLLSSSLAAQSLQEQIASQANAARKILNSWHSIEPRREVRSLHLVYWTPSDREPAPGYAERISRMMLHIREFYAREMARNGFGPRTINLLRDDEHHQLRIHLVRGREPYANYDRQSGSKIRDECLPALQEAGISANRETILIFCNMGDWDPEALTIRHRSPYYAGGNFQGGTAWQLDSPILDSMFLLDRTPMIQDGEYGRISLGKHNSIFIGGIAHELGHALGLPHNKARSDESQFGTALMGAGNRSYADELRGEGAGSFLTFNSALRLASHPQFSRSTKGLGRPTKAEMIELSAVANGDRFMISGRIVSAPPCYGVAAYLDPATGQDYDATTVTTIPDSEGRFSLDCWPLKSGASGELRLLGYLVNGATTQRRLNYSVSRDGRPDLTKMQTTLALIPVIRALHRGNAQAAEVATKKLADRSLAKRVAMRLISPNEQLATTEIPAEATTLALSAVLPVIAEVGWIGPRYDRTPPPLIALHSGGEFHERGIYAHAPARHVYNLGKSWKTLEAHCGMANGHRGSVIFQVLGDGTELWRSELVNDASAPPTQFKIDVSSVDRLELLVEDAGDGNASDWGLWLSPRLMR